MPCNKEGADIDIVNSELIKVNLYYDTFYISFN